MARLGKKEREAKHALIKSNLNNMGSLERSSGTMGSYLSTTHMLARTHVGFRDAHNVKGTSGRAPSTKRWAAK